VSRRRPRVRGAPLAPFFLEVGAHFYPMSAYDNGQGLSLAERGPAKTNFVYRANIWTQCQAVDAPF
jgi:hypothetical protein